MLFGVLFVGSISIQSCKKEEGCGATNISKHNGNESHNMGQNCMNCHKDGGQGEGCFNVAGTVYDSMQSATAANGTIRLYTQPNGGGTLRATIEVDKLGNFHTTDNVDFAGGLYPTVQGANGNIKYMSSPVTTGQCNSCHGGSTAKIWVQ